MNFTISEKAYPTYYRRFSPGDRETYITKEQELSDRPVTALHHHPSFELGFCKSGSGKVFIDDKIYDFTEGSVTLIRANQPHIACSAPGTRSVWYWIYFNPIVLFSDADMQCPPLFDSCYSGVFDQELCRLFRACNDFSDAAKRDQEGEHDRLDRFELALSAGRLLLEAARIGCESSPVFRTSRAIRFISNNFGDPALMREETIAREAGFSVSHLRSLFVRETGMPPRSFISRTRLAAAANLLTETRMRIIDVSEKCGFESLSGFNRKFREVYKMTPGEYRKNFGDRL